MSYLAEQNVIGSLLLDGGCMEQIYSLLEPEMFAVELLGRIYMEFQRGYDNHYDVNPVVLLQKVSGDGYPEHVISEELKSCVTVTVSSTQVKSYALAVRSEYRAGKAGEILNAVRITPEDVDGQIGALIQRMEGLMESRGAVSKPLPRVVRENRDDYFREREVERLDTGISSLDSILGGLEGGDMVVIGARPAVGKSAFVTQIAAYMAEHGKKVGFYNLEMKEKQIYERFVVAKSGIGITRLRRAVKFLGDEQERFDRANAELELLDNIVLTTGSKSPAEIRAEVRHMGYDVIIIDYLQLLKPDRNYRGNRYAEVGDISHSIKGIAMELNIPVIALSQLNRSSEGREDKKPSMSELREAGDIEQDASVIILLWNKEKDNRSIKGCCVEKQRQGETGEVELLFDGDKMQFADSTEWNVVDEDTDNPFR